MLLIPIHILLDDKPQKISSLLNIDSVGVSRKTIKNVIAGNQKLSSKSIDKICLEVSGLFSDVYGCDINNILLKEMLSNPIDTTRIKYFKFIEDEYTQYFRKIFGEILELDRCFSDDITEMRKDPIKKRIKSFIDLVYNTNYPANMLSDNIFEKNSLPLNNASKTLNRIRIDIMFYLSSAYEVEYNYRFYKKVNGNKSLTARYLPVIEEKTVKNPIEIWIDYLIQTNGYRSINEFAKSIPQLTVNPKDNNDVSKLRMMRKWRSGKIFPTWENINCISETIAKKHYKGDDNKIEYLKEQGRFFAAYIKIYQKLLNMMLKDSQNQFGINERGVVDYFERYLYWHNYHSVCFKDQINQSQPNSC